MNLLERLHVAPKAIPHPPKSAIVALLIIIGVVIAVCAVGATMQLTHRNRVLPHTTYGGIDVSGLDRLAASAVLQDAWDNVLEQGLTVRVKNVEKTIALQVVSADVTATFADFDVNHAVDTVLARGTATTVPNVLAAAWQGTFGYYAVPAAISLDTDALAEAIRTAFPEAEEAGVPTDFVITFDGDAIADIAITEPVNGTSFDFATAFATLAHDAEDFALQPLDIALTTVHSSVSVAEAKTLLADVRAAVEAAPYTVVYAPDDGTEEQTWELTAHDVSMWVLPVEQDGATTLALDANSMNEWLTDLHAGVDVEAQNARFLMENNRVSEFAPSRDGVTVNNSAMLTAIAETFGQESARIPVVVDTIAAEITTGNVNNLGITELLGTGVSSYAGSPRNRIANIRHGMSKLNGLLVAPGETVSLIEELGPFTIADGYLPELVIKGDEIKPEVGGGLCQIGSTTFRAVMNAGLKVVERRNHSLVVSYYNDLSNGNPGTDATIYDPAPDFKFQNDMANYVLLVTEMDEEAGRLNFSFWGTPDGRSGSYEPPTVLTWSGYGETQYKETDSLPPGEMSCQSPHPGATTTFTYTVNYADGTTHEEEFFSSYRSLPKICLVGKTATPDTENPTPDNSTVTPEISTEDITPLE